MSASLLAQRKSADLTVELHWEVIDGIDHMIVTASDANGTCDLIPKDRREAVAMFHHPYVYEFDKYANVCG
jgi:hypothetical protein